MLCFTFALYVYIYVYMQLLIIAITIQSTESFSIFVIKTDNLFVNADVNDLFISEKKKE